MVVVDRELNPLYMAETERPFLTIKFSIQRLSYFIASLCAGGRPMLFHEG